MDLKASFICEYGFDCLVEPLINQIVNRESNQNPSYVILEPLSQRYKNILTSEVNI